MNNLLALCENINIISLILLISSLVLIITNFLILLKQKRLKRWQFVLFCIGFILLELSVGVFIYGKYNAVQRNRKRIEYYSNKSNTTLMEKPVIYLYGYDGDVRVGLDLDERISLLHSYPKYKNGWRITAYPDGRLFDGEGRQYNYLFWEGDSETDIDWDMSSGCCVEGRNTEAFLESALRKLGLNDCEADDFITYWLPQMEDNTYNVISFQGSDYTDTVSITTIPSCDAEIRVYMTWYPSDEYVELPRQTIKDMTNYNRTGKTVVEWGGTQINKGDASANIKKNSSDYGETFDGVGNTPSTEGTHEFTDCNGDTHNFTEDEWEKIQEAWSWTGNPDFMIQKQTVQDLLDTLSVLK